MRGSKISEASLWINRIRRGIPLVLSAVCFCFLTPARAGAQVATADIVGSVTEQSGARVVSGTATVTNTGTGVTQKMNLSSEGTFEFTLLQVGTYNVSVQAPGFKSFVTQVTVAAGDRARVNAGLTVGQAEQTISVESTTPALQTDDSTIGTLITSDETQNLPLNGRNITNLVTVSAGVTGGMPNAMNGGTRPDDRRQTASFSANGQSDIVNNNMIDGMDNNEQFIGAIGVRPSIDAIQEVRVLTNLYSAEISRTGGGVVDLITKSGTNRFHGTLFEFVRNNVFDARDFFATTGPMPELRQNQFGGSIGGPIKKDKAFFFFDYEAFRQVKGITTTSTVPTLFEEQNPGNFSDLGQGCVNLTSIAGWTPDPIGLNYFKLYPAPNNNVAIPGEGCAPPTANFTYTARQTTFTSTYDAKVDYRFSPRDSAYVRYTYNNSNAFIPGPFPLVNGVNPGSGPYGSFPGPANDFEQSVALDYTHILSSNLILDLKAQYMGLNNESNPLNVGKEFATQFGFPGTSSPYAINLPGDAVSSGLPNISFTQPYSSLGDADYVPLLDKDNTFQYVGQVSWLKGPHSLKFGFSIFRRQVLESQSSHPRGNSTVDNQDPDLLGTGNDMAVLLTGQAQSATRGYQVVVPHTRSWQNGFYAQDDWRVSPSLTLNLGIRYDIYTPYTATNGALTNFVPSLGLLIGPTLPGRQHSGPTAGITTDWGDVGPRFGFEYAVKKSLVVRGGFGVAWVPVQPGPLKNAPFSFNFSCGDTAAPINSQVACTSPLSGTNGSWYLDGGLPIPSTNITLATDPSTYASQGGINGTDLNYKNQFLESYSLNVENDFHGNVATIAYIGNHGGNWPTSGPNINQQPYAGAPYPYPNLPGVNMQQGLSVLWSNYNALQGSIQRRIRNGLAANINYTWSHNLTNATIGGEGSPTGSCVGGCHVDNGRGQSGTYNSFYQYDYGNADLDNRQSFALTMTYDLPFGQNLRGPAALVVKGWTVNSIYYARKGIPITVESTVNNSGLPITDRPNQTGNPQGSFHSTIKEWFDVTKFSLPAANLLGNVHRNSVIGPGSQALAFSVFKEFPIYESVKLQFRCEAFNLFNTPTFAQPNNSISYNSSGVGIYNGSAGQISSTDPHSSPRQIQLALKLIF